MGENDVLKEKVTRIETRINRYGERLDILEQDSVKWEQQIKHLVEKIDGLITTMRWAMGLGAGTLVGFFIWYIQNLR